MRKNVVLLALAAVVAMPSIGVAKVRAVSTDGEATVYRAGDFTREFDISYDVQFPPSQGNRSWTFVSLLLLGGRSGSGSISVGLSRGSSRDATFPGFVYVARPNSSPVYRRIEMQCSLHCAIELRGDSSNIYAVVRNRLVGTWRRTSLHLVKPYMQVNAEVTAIGDRISAHLTPLRSEIAGHPAPPPTCAFTTQGVRVHAAAGGLSFTGQRDPHAGATFISLQTGATGDTCREATAKAHPR